MAGNEYATIDSILPEKIEHIRGTIERTGGGVTFWLSRPCPKGIDADEWERKEQARWDNIFGKKERDARS